MVHLFVWIGVAVLYYLVFSLFFDTPIEYEVRKTNKELSRQYELLSNRLDSLNRVMENVVERDKNVYSMLFEAAPYSSTEELSGNWESADKLLTMSNNELASLLYEKLSKLNADVTSQTGRFENLQYKMQEIGDGLNYIPAIQPVNNNELTKLAASYGMRIHPFYKSMASHQGVDFAVPEETRVFAVADGVVANVGTTEQQGKGVSITIDHGNGYRTFYGHLNKANVRRGQRVRRGDIIAHSGNTGLSFMPHLHYEVIFEGRRVDPINYFFYELDHRNTIQMQKVAQIGMQSLD